MAKVRLNRVRLAFPELWEAVSMEAGQAKKFGATFLFPPTHPATAMITAAIKEVAVAKFKDKADAELAAMKAEGKICLRNGNLKPNYDGYPGNLFIRASSDVMPTILDRDGETFLLPASGRPYGGCEVNAIIEIWAQKNQYGKRINATLKGVQFWKDGDAFGAGPPASPDEFEAAEDLGMPDADEPRQPVREVEDMYS